MTIHHKFAVINGINMHYVEIGQGPLVILLHGFPEFWYSWRHQLPALAEAGFRVVAPDMRGYAQSEAPKEVSSYQLDILADDIVSLVHHLGEERAHIVGHDWGAIVAWHIAMWHPACVQRLAILNVPHPKRFEENIYRSPRQLLKSWYVFAFQLPWLPEFCFAFANFLALRLLLRHDPARADAFGPEAIAQYTNAFSDSAHIRGPINYYRAAFRSSLREPLDVQVIRSPTLVIWGIKDRFLETFLAEPNPSDVPDCRVEYLDASHWVQVDAAEEVNRLLSEFLLRRDDVDQGPKSVLTTP